MLRGIPFAPPWLTVMPKPALSRLHRKVLSPTKALRPAKAMPRPVQNIVNAAANVASLVVVAVIVVRVVMVPVTSRAATALLAAAATERTSI